LSSLIYIYSSVCSYHLCIREFACSQSFMTFYVFVSLPALSPSRACSGVARWPVFLWPGRYFDNISARSRYFENK